jgi:hypothetical protein
MATTSAPATGANHNGGRLAAFAGILSIAPGAAGVFIAQMWTFRATPANATERAQLACRFRTASVRC